MATTPLLKRIVFGALLSGSMAATGMALSVSTAQADPWPGCETNTGPCHWCPGQEAPHTGNHVTDPVRWDWNVCHTYYYVYPGQGNVANMIWDGDDPPPPPPRLPAHYGPCPPIAFMCP